MSGRRDALSMFIFLCFMSCKVVKLSMAMKTLSSPLAAQLRDNERELLMENMRKHISRTLFHFNCLNGVLGLSTDRG